MGRPVQRWLDRYQEQRPLEDRGAARFVHGPRRSETQRSVRGRAQGLYKCQPSVPCLSCGRDKEALAFVSYGFILVRVRVAEISALAFIQNQACKKRLLAAEVEIFSGH